MLTKAPEAHTQVGAGGTKIQGGQGQDWVSGGVAVNPCHPSIRSVPLTRLQVLGNTWYLAFL